MLREKAALLFLFCLSGLYLAMPCLVTLEFQPATESGRICASPT